VSRDPRQGRLITTPAKRYLVLLGGGIANDGRVIRSVRAISRIARVDLLCLDARDEDRNLFDDNVEIHSLPAYDYRPAGLAGHLNLHRQFDGFAAKALSLGVSFDAVHANDFPTLKPAAEIARKTGAKLVYDSHELFLETVNQFYHPSGLVKRLAVPAIVWASRRIGRRVERRLIREVDLFLTTNPHYAEWFVANYGVPEPAIVMNVPERVEARKTDRLRERLGIPGTDRIVLYQGVMNRGRGLTSLVRSAAGFDEGIRLVLVGRGPLESQLRMFGSAPDLEGRVFFTGMVPYDELPPLTASADLGVLILSPMNLSKKLSSANKIFEYMAAGIPILATDFPENRRVVAETDSGWLVKGRNAASLALAVNGIFADPDEMRRRGENGRRAHTERYNWAREEERLLAHLSELLPA
jgi:glycosyltransferase involved in cell wall biosynthesis